MPLPKAMQDYPNCPRAKEKKGIETMKPSTINPAALLFFLLLLLLLILVAMSVKLKVGKKNKIEIHNKTPNLALLISLSQDYTVFFFCSSSRKTGSRPKPPTSILIPFHIIPYHFVSLDFFPFSRAASFVAYSPPPTISDGGTFFSITFFE